MRVWRVCKAEYASSAFSGEGGLHAPARWHHKGHLIVYTSQSLSLATLETWVHAREEEPTRNRVAVYADIPDNMAIHEISESILPANWRRTDNTVLELRELGTEWLNSNQSAVARVPAVVTAGEFNYLLNPLHPGFRFISCGTPKAFEFDPRMKRK